MSEYIKDFDKQIENVRKDQTKVTGLNNVTTEIEIHWRCSIVAGSIRRMCQWAGRKVIEHTQTEQQK